MRKRCLIALMQMSAMEFAPWATRGGGQQPDFSNVQIKATKVSGNIYMLEGAGGNIGASLGEDGIGTTSLRRWRRRFRRR
jgi:hypothetical protein